MILGTKDLTEISTEKSTPAIDENFRTLRQQLIHLQSQTVWTGKLKGINACLLSFDIRLVREYIRCGSTYQDRSS